MCSQCVPLQAVAQHTNLIVMLAKQCVLLPGIAMQPCMSCDANDTLSYYQGRMMVA